MDHATAPAVFVIRSLYDQLPSRDNLRKWGMVEDSRCVLYGKVTTLRHVLSSCKYARSVYMAAQRKQPTSEG